MDVEDFTDDTIIEVLDPLEAPLAEIARKHDAAIQAAEEAAIAVAETSQKLERFAIVDKAIWSDKTIKDSAKVVYGYLAACRNAKSNLICPSVATMCANTGLARKTVVLGLKSLEIAGYIKREKRYANHLQTSSGYSLASIASVFGKASNEEQRHLHAVTASNSAPVNVAPVTPIKPAQQHPSTSQRKTAPVTSIKDAMPTPTKNQKYKGRTTPNRSYQEQLADTDRRPKPKEFNPQRDKSGGWADPDNQVYGKSRIQELRDQLQGL